MTKLVIVSVFIMNCFWMAYGISVDKPVEVKHYAQVENNTFEHLSKWTE